ncbi:MAG: hypothetical protein H0X36_07610 [Sphingomonadaceae bacterium]|nr:hypothetical protein [Sphingomonadaceae bacterium]
MLILAILAAAASTAAAPPAASRRCDKPEYRQFDFWVGHWDVFDAHDKSRAGESVIEKLYDGCALRENWRDPQLSGGSLNAYGAADGKWRQTWIDSAGLWREFVGGMDGANMVLIWHHPSRAMPGRIAQERMTFTPLPDGSVRQHMDQTADGATWVEGYDYIYRRAAD